jgi:hypothetical protein
MNYICPTLYYGKMEDFKMARPQGSTNNTVAKAKAVVSETKIIEEVKDTTINTELEKENKDLKSQLEQMMKMIEGLQNAQTNNNKTSSDEMSDIDMNKRISVTSITTGGVNLRTANDGTAKTFRFDRLGQTLPILYLDLLNCINFNRSFFEEGLIYINNQKVIEDNYLEDFYKQFLDIDKITNIMNFDIETIKDMVTNTTVAIQETIVLLVADKLNKGGSVDMNKIDAIGKSCTKPVDIRELANKLR